MGAVFTEDLFTAHNAGTVDQPVDRAKGGHCSGHGRLGGICLADVRHSAARLLAQRQGLGGHCFGVQVHQHHFGTCLDQHVRRGGTQPRCTTGDDKNLVFDLHDDS